jgi:hypothetical protein
LFPQQQFTAIKASTNGSHTINTTFRKLYGIKASTNSPYPSQLGTSEISIESKLQQQMLHNIKATSETTLLKQSFNKCSSTTSKLLQKAQSINLYQQIKQNHSRSEDY